MNNVIIKSDVHTFNGTLQDLDMNGYGHNIMINFDNKGEKINTKILIPIHYYHNTRKEIIDTIDNNV